MMNRKDQEKFITEAPARLAEKIDRWKNDENIKEVLRSKPEQEVPTICPRCDGTGLADSGGTYPWGEPISIPCDCDTE